MSDIDLITTNRINNLDDDLNDIKSSIITNYNELISELNSVNTTLTKNINSVNTTLTNSISTTSSTLQSDIDTKYNELLTKINNNYNTLNTAINNVASRVTTLESRKMVKETYVNGTSWYRIWTDGWIEQGFRIQSTTDAQTNHTFLKPFKDTNYTLLITIQTTTTKLNGAQPDWITSYSTTGFTYHCDSYGGQPWIYACGF